MTGRDARNDGERKEHGGWRPGDPDRRRSSRPWRPGDPDRRRASLSLLTATGTRREDHAPEPASARARQDRLLAASAPEGESAPALEKAKTLTMTLIEALLPLDPSLVNQSLVAELGELARRLDSEIERFPPTASPAESGPRGDGRPTG